MNPSQNFFDYNQIKAQLLPRTRSMQIILGSTHFNHEILFELESIFNWLSSHPEVNSVILTSESDEFAHGWDEDELLHMSDSKHYQTLERVQKLVVGMFYLPQTIVADLGEGASALGLEFTLGADIRVARHGARLNFCSLTQGRVNTCGGIGVLELVVSSHYARQWNLINGPINSEQLLYSGLIHQFYSQAPNTIQEILESIYQQSPLARIQTKRSLLEGVREKLENLKNREFDFATAALGQRDWHESILAKREQRRPNFTGVKDMAKALQDNKRSAAKAQTL